MPLNDKPLIVLTNDDGVHSPGLAAAVTALEQLGEVLVVAPLVQQSGTGRSMPNYTSGAITAQRISVAGRHHAGYAVDGTPAQCVQRALLVLAQRPVALVVAGINYGENVGSGITISGTVGAALEAASMGVPALAISLETAVDQHHSHSAAVDFTVAAHFTRVMARLILDAPRTHDVDVLKVDVPIAATIASARCCSRATTRSTNRRFSLVSACRCDTASSAMCPGCTASDGSNLSSWPIADSASAQAIVDSSSASSSEA